MAKLKLDHAENSLLKTWLVMSADTLGGVCQGWVMCTGVYPIASKVLSASSRLVLEGEAGLVTPLPTTTALLSAILMDLSGSLEAIETDRRVGGRSSSAPLLGQRLRMARSGQLWVSLVLRS